MLADGAGEGAYRRQCTRQPLPVVAAVDAGVDLSVAGADVDAFGVEAVGVERFAVDALVALRAQRDAGGRAPTLRRPGGRLTAPTSSTPTMRATE